MSAEEDHPTGTNTSNAKTPVPNAKTVLKKPVVLIAGAGIGGLMTALLCETANLKYFVFERVATVKPLGIV